MSTATRLGIFGVGLAVAFAGSFAVADIVVPESTVATWIEEAEGHGADGHTDHDAAEATAGGPSGVSSSSNGYLLSPVAAPTKLGVKSPLTFRVLTDHGDAVTQFRPTHEKDLHLIVVRTDGTRFRHVHPTLDEAGTWSLPWEWTAAGTYRIFADFVPAAADNDEPITLTRTVEVAGNVTPSAPAPTAVASVAGFTVELDGDLVPGSTSPLALTVSRDGKPVTQLQPYLGAFGHLVALREGDLAYLHVHPEGHGPTAGELSGPQIRFATEAPTPGRYLLYLDFQVDDRVYTAPFVLDTTEHTH